MRNALLELETQLQRIEPFPMDDKKDTALTRVPPPKSNTAQNIGTYSRYEEARNSTYIIGNITTP